jgi:hypothetical protein
MLAKAYVLLGVYCFIDSLFSALRWIPAYAGMTTLFNLHKKDVNKKRQLKINYRAF